MVVPVVAQEAYFFHKMSSSREVYQSVLAGEESILHRQREENKASTAQWEPSPQLEVEEGGVVSTMETMMQLEFQV